MNLLDLLIAASSAPVVAADPDYVTYLSEVDAANASRSCKRCGSSGHFPEYAHINGGACFHCNGEAARVDAPMTYAEWARNRADALGFEGFTVMVRA